MRISGASTSWWCRTGKELLLDALAQKAADDQGDRYSDGGDDQLPLDELIKSAGWPEAEQPFPARGSRPHLEDEISRGASFTNRSISGYTNLERAIHS